MNTKTLASIVVVYAVELLLDGAGMDDDHRENMGERLGVYAAQLDPSMEGLADAGFGLRYGMLDPRPFESRLEQWNEAVVTAKPFLPWIISKVQPSEFPSLVASHLSDLAAQFEPNIALELRRFSNDALLCH